MIAGPLNEFVTLYRPSVSIDGFGAETTSYAEAGRIRAQVSWKSGAVHEEVSELFADGRVEVIVRDAHTVAEKWRLSFRGILYCVVAVEHNRRRGMKRLLCERVND